MHENPASSLGYNPADAVTLPPWKTIASTLAAVLLGILFFVSGSWKLTDPFTWSQALTEFKVPSSLAMPGTLGFGIAEAFGAVLILVPRFRRWGALLIALLLIAFMGYFAINYATLAGKDCSCFPLVKRTVGPGFFIGDGVMLALAAMVWAWSRRSSHMRAAVVVLAVVTVFAGVSLGVNINENSGIHAPATITVDGKPFSLHEGHIFVFFYDPECMHCDAAARRMSKLNWKDTKVVGIPTRMPQFAASFLHDTGLKAGTSNDLKLMRDTFKFVDPPYGVALDKGKQIAVVANFEESEPAKTLREIGYIAQP